MKFYLVVGMLSACCLLSVHNASAQKMLIQGDLMNGCEPNPGPGSFCKVQANWPAPFADTNYVVTCTATGTDFRRGDGTVVPYDIVVPFDPPDKTRTSAMVMVRDLGVNPIVGFPDYKTGEGSPTVLRIQCIAFHG